MIKDLGAQKSGSKRYLWQTYTSIMLIPLGAWVIYFLISCMNLNYEQVVTRLQCPINSGLMILFVCNALGHFHITLSVIVQDYIHTKWMYHLVKLMLNFGFLLLAIVTIMSLARL